MIYTILDFEILNGERFNEERVKVLLKNSLDFLNERFKEYLVEEAVIKRTKRVYASFKDPMHCFLFSKLLKLFMFPIKVCCSIHFGEDYETDSSETSFKADDYLKSCVLNDQAFCITCNKFDEPYSKLPVANNLANKNVIYLSLDELIENNIMQIFAEIICPLVVNIEDKYPILDFNKLKNVIDSKYRVINGNFEHDSFSTYSTDSIKFDILEKYYVKEHLVCEALESYDRDESFLNNCWNQSLSRRLAKVLNTTNAMVDKTLKSLEYAKQRNNDCRVISIINDLVECENIEYC